MFQVQYKLSSINSIYSIKSITRETVFDSSPPQKTKQNKKKTLLQ